MYSNPVGLFIFFILLGTISSQTEISTTQKSPIKLSYSELQHINATCPPVKQGPTDSCDSKRRDNGSAKERTCACDNQCVIYNDCCIDATPKTASLEGFSQQKVQFVCQAFVNVGYIYVRSQCASYWRGPDSIREGCEISSANQSAQDPLSSMPVTNKVAGTTYKNHFCATCNNENQSSIAIWPPLLQFTTPNLKSYNDTFGNVTMNYVRNNLSYNPSANAWGIWLWSTDIMQEEFFEAEINPSVPSGLEEKVRECRPDLISRCPANWTDDSVAQKCAGFQGAVYRNTVESTKGYRNAFCAICNGQLVKNLVCVQPKGKTGGLLHRINNKAFSVLLDFHDPKGGTVGNTDATCPDGQVYDPFHKMCKQLLCGFPWLVVVDNKCVPATPRKKTTTTPTALKSADVEGKSLFPEVVITTETTSFDRITTQSPDTTSYVPPTAMPTDFDESPTTFANFIDSDGLTLPSTTDESGTTMEPVFVMVTTAKPSSPRTTTENIIPTEAPQVTVIYDVSGDGNKSDTKIVALTENVTYAEIEYRGVNSPFDEVPPQDLDYEQSTESVSEDVSTIAYDPAFIECQKVELDQKQYNLLENGSINVPAYKKTYDPSNFLIIENQALVCAFFINSTEEESKFSPAMGYVTSIGLGISIACLVLHLILYIVLPDMRNLATNNLASLSIGLIAAYTSFLIGQNSSLKKIPCTIVASCTYFFFLACFFWMSTMSFDVWRTLKLATHELRVSTGRQYKRFVLYSLFSWGLPALCLAAALIVDESPTVPIEYRPGFAVGKCWFNQRNALLVFFAAPLIAVMVTNIALFISSARMILSTTSSTSKHQSCTANSRRDFKLYLRLGVMMGLTWAVGLVAGYLNNEILWYAFVLLNTTQGLLIFISFSCTKKVKKLLGDRMEAITRSRAYRTSSLNSGSAFNTNSHTFPSNESTKTSTTAIVDSRMSVNSLAPGRKPAFRPSVTSFRQLQDGMETLY